jgi:hypothetical protein
VPIYLESQGKFGIQPLMIPTAKYKKALFIIYYAKHFCENLKEHTVLENSWEA